MLGTFSKGDCFIAFGVKQSFFPPCKPSRSETYVSTSVKEIDYVQLGIVNQAELKLQPRAFFSFYAINISVDVFYPVPVAAVAFPAVTIVTTLAYHGEAIRGIHEHLQGVPIEEDMSTLRFRMGMAKAQNASMRGKIRTMEAIETVTRSQERRARIEMER
uniref:Uncharacterized protein n=1 Tax=Tanacetum cinerariifolium TaxID=118510 RepID=A0A6L2M1I3_TANCI|nr:hypothetical protein [Tanacetum cinerariifolium]